MLKEIKFRNVELDKDEATAEMLRDFDMDADEKISIDEFVSGVTKWLDDTKQALGKRYLSKKSLKHLYQVPSFATWFKIFLIASIKTRFKFIESLAKPD